MSTAKLNELIEECKNSMLNAWVEGRDSSGEGPWLLYLNPTNVCNNKCRMCPHDYIMRKDRGMMSMEVFEAILATIPATVRKVYFLKQGEPFLNKHTIDMMALMKKTRPEIHISVHTNGTVPLKGRMEELLSVVDSIGFSISAISRETYATVHGCDHFDRVMENLSEANELLGAMPENERPYVLVSHVKQLANAHETKQEIIDFYMERAPNLASVDFHPMFNWQGEIEEANLQIADVIPEKNYPCCILPWGTMTICHDGKISYCQEEPRENLFLGDATKQSLSEIWRGEPFGHFRKLMAERKYSQLLEEGFGCKRCSFLWNIHTQAPQNITTGFSTKLKGDSKDPRYGNLLTLTPEELLEYVAKSYLNGDLDRAIGAVTHFDIVGCPEEFSEARDTLKTLCSKAIGQYAGLYEIKATLARLGDEIEPAQYVHLKDLRHS